jgi:hypothetical protein
MDFTASVSVQQKHVPIAQPNIETLVSDSLSRFAVEQSYGYLTFLRRAQNRSDKKEKNRESIWFHYVAQKRKSVWFHAWNLIKRRF